MNWWQSLLIAIVPALITASITLTISLMQNNKTKRELVNKYDLEQKNHISQTRFDTEFTIYKEISEKLVGMVTNVVTNMFPVGKSFYPLIGEREYYQRVYASNEESFNKANVTICQYAIFIPQKWYEQFIEMQELCRCQIIDFLELRINLFDIYKNPIKQSQEYLDRESACYSRIGKINSIYESLVKELRTYLEKMNTLEV